MILFRRKYPRWWFDWNYPRQLFNFIEGIMRWHNRVLAYALILVTDAYPPFRLSA